MNSIKLIPFEYVINDTYERIINNKPYDDKLKPYSVDFLELILEGLIEREEYMKCQVIHDFMKTRYDHISNYECIKKLSQINNDF